MATIGTFKKTGSNEFTGEIVTLSVQAKGVRIVPDPVSYTHLDVYKRQAYAALVEGKTILDLAESLQLRRVRVMGGDRIELSGFTDAMRERLRADGLFSEIISWKLRFFVPIGADGAAIIGKLIDRYPIQRVGEREAA